MRWCGFLLLACVYVIGKGAPAQAQKLTRAQLRAAEEVLALDRQAMDLFAQLEFELARRSLAKALANAENARIEQHPVAVRCHVHLAYVTLVGLKDDVQALVHLQQALALDPDVKIPEDQRRPDFLALLAKAQGHPTADQAGPAQASRLADAEDVSDDDEVNQASAERAPPARGQANTVLPAAMARDEDSPLSQEADEENPLESSEGAYEGPDLGGKLILGFGLGTGIGYAKGDGLEAYKEYNNAFAPGMTTSGGGHILPEIGWQFARHWGVSLSGRHQL